MVAYGKEKDVVWWEDDEPHKKLVRLARHIDSSQQQNRRALNIHHLRLYSDRDLYGSGGASWGGGAMADRLRTVSVNMRRPKLSINVVRNMCNAATSMICRSRPRPFFLTTGGDFDLQQKAKRRTQFCEAVFSEEQTYGLGEQAVQHGNVLGTGCIEIIRDYASKKVRHEVVYIGEILVDESEAVYGKPRNYFRVRSIDKAILRRMYPDAEEHAIEHAVSAETWPASSDTTDTVIVVQAWHLPADDEDVGSYAVVTDGGTLHSEPYKWKDPPFAFFRWEREPLGFYGTGIPSELTGVQYEINETIRNIQANWWAGGNLKVLVPRGSKITKAQLSNDLRGTVIDYTGQAPTWMTTDAVAPGLVQHLDRLIQYAYEVTGISQLSAQSQTPAASMSGRARLVHENSESLRFLPAQRRHEQFYIDIARRTMEAAADLKDQVGDFEAVFAGKDYLDPIKYSEIEAGDDVYDIQCTPTSILPSTPAGKLDFVEAMEARGYVADKSQAMKLLDFPDLKREMDFETAAYDLISERLTKILQGKEYIPPTPEMDLQLALKLSLGAILLAENRNVKPARIEKLREWRATVETYLPKPPPPAPPMGGPPMPPGMPPTGPGLPAPAFPEQVPMPPQTVIAPQAA